MAVAQSATHLLLVIFHSIDYYYKNVRLQSKLKSCQKIRLSLISADMGLSLEFFSSHFKFLLIIL